MATLLCGERSSKLEDEVLNEKRIFWRKIFPVLRLGH